jgi:NodT family efflux transporter outer membrane factor (OMF) lipoprotein
MSEGAARQPARSRISVAGGALGCAIMAATLTACAVGPNYHRPAAVVSTGFKENRGWVPAMPAQIPADQQWWTIYNDPVLNSLESQVEVSNQNIKAAEAAYRNAAQVVDAVRGQLLPDVSIGLTGNHSGEAPGATSVQQTTAVGHVTSLPYVKFTTVSLQAQGSWALDIWGRVRRQVESESDLAQVSAAEVAAARLSAQISLAEDYFQMRASEQAIRIYDTYIADLENSLQIVQNEVRAGTDTLADVYAAQTQLESTQVSAINETLTRATYEHAIAVLIGHAPADLAVPEGSFPTVVPVVPAGVPSELLERRPDIAEAERTMASDNALRGVATAAWFPSLTMTGDFGYNHNKLVGLISSDNALWSFGPQIAETIFNGGARLAQSREARAQYDESVANYRQTVLTALQAVENDLVTLRVLQQSHALDVTAVNAAELSEQLYTNQFKAGIVSYASVLTEQTTRLGSELTLLAIQSQQLVASVDLISQLGGGWSAAELNQRDRGVPTAGLRKTADD